MPTLHLIDGSSYFYRAFHAMPALKTTQGTPTGAVYGMTMMLKNLLAKYQPILGAIVFDAKGKTFRDEISPDYKANRPKTPDELTAQFPYVFDMVQALGLPVIMQEGVEADDVIGTLAKQAESQGMKTLIFTSDKDFAQLVNDFITLVDERNNTRLDMQGVEEKFGIPPALIVDYLSLVGDTADNIKGVDKVGKKTAVKWLKIYGSLENILARADEMTGKVGENLRTALPYLREISPQLLNIKCDVPLSVTPNELRIKAFDNNTLAELFTALEFKQWLTELSSDSQDNVEKSKPYFTILKNADFERWLKRLKNAPFFAFHLTANSDHYFQENSVGIAIGTQAKEAIYIPFAHDYLGAPPQLSRENILSALKPLFENPEQVKVGHNLKQETHLLAKQGIECKGLIFDNLLATYVLDSTATRYDFDSLAFKYLGVKTSQFQEIAGKGKKHIAFSQIDVNQAGNFACEKVDLMGQLYQDLSEKLDSLPKIANIFNTIEIPLLTILAKMEHYGIQLDVAKLQAQSAELANRLQVLENTIYSMAGEEFNLNSPKQLQAILFEKLQLPILGKTKGGQASTSVSVLEELAVFYPLPRLVLDYRSLSKLKSTYTDALPKQVNTLTGCIHTTYQQAGTATGRLSSQAPNLQNIPIRSAEGRQIRQAFIAPKNYLLLSADYSQIELRIMAFLSKDEKLLSAFKSGADIHQATASEVFDISLNKVTAEERRQAKAVNFGLIYGMQAFGLAKQLGVTRQEAQNFIDTYFERYPRIKIFMDETRALARAQGYVETFFGRRLYIPDINVRNVQRRHYAERSAINAPLQGTAADIIKLSMIQLDNAFENKALDIKLLLQVHDELIFQVEKSIIEQVSENIKEIMESASSPIDVPVNIGIGKNWAEAH